MQLVGLLLNSWVAAAVPSAGRALPSAVPVNFWLLTPRDGPSDGDVKLCRRVVNVEYRRKTESGDKDPECVALLHVALGQVRVLSQLYALAGQRKVSTFGACRFQDQECVRTHARADWSLFPPN